MIQWAGGTFVVLPSVPNSAVPEDDLPTDSSDRNPPEEIQPLAEQIETGISRRKISHTVSVVNPYAGAVATEASPSQTSRLVLRRAKPTDGGRYVCSVLTEAGRDDHKFVHVSIVGKLLVCHMLFTFAIIVPYRLLGRKNAAFVNLNNSNSDRLCG